MLILHVGAKTKGLDMKDRILGPSGLVQSLDNYRAQINIKDPTDIKAEQNAPHAILSAWI